MLLYVVEGYCVCEAIEERRRRTGAGLEITERSSREMEADRNSFPNADGVLVCKIIFIPNLTLTQVDLKDEHCVDCV